MVTLVTIAALTAALAPAQAVGDADLYAGRRSAALAQCAGIDPDASQTGMIFNPAGHRSVYFRSVCLQEAAVRFRDASLCADVRERRSLFFSSWGYSPARCRTLVDEAQAEDRRHLETLASRYQASPTRLRDFSLSPHGNGRDFEIVPAFDAGEPRSYHLSFEIVDSAAPEGSAVIHTSGYHLSGESNLSIFVRRADIAAAFGAFVPGQRYRVRATLVLDVGIGRNGGWWSDQFVEGVFPRADRSHVLTKDVTF